MFFQQINTRFFSITSQSTNNDINRGHLWLQLLARMSLHKGTTLGLWQSYLPIAPEVKYWFSAKGHHGQERCATLVKKQCTPTGMMGGGQTEEKKIQVVMAIACKKSQVRLPHLQSMRIYWSKLMSHSRNVSFTPLSFVKGYQELI